MGGNVKLEKGDTKLIASPSSEFDLDLKQISYGAEHNMFVLQELAQVWLML